MHTLATSVYNYVSHFCVGWTTLMLKSPRDSILGHITIIVAIIAFLLE